MALILPLPAPQIERIVHHHALLQLFMVIGNQARQAQRKTDQTGRLRGDFRMPGIGAIMGEGAVGDILGNGIRGRSSCFDFSGLHIKKLGAGINEAFDQRGAGNTIDLRAFAGNPARGGVHRLDHQGMAGCAQAFCNAVFDKSGLEAAGAQCLGDV